MVPEQSEDMAVSHGAYRFDEVQDEARPSLQIRMEDPHPRVETHSKRGQLALGPQEAITQIEEGVDRVSGVPSGSGCHG